MLEKTEFRRQVKKNLMRLPRALPFALTFSNAFFGLLAVLFTLENDFVASAYCILIAAGMDGFDGRVARLLGSDSHLGGELDSLCDAVSFCLAPAVLMYHWRLAHLGIWGLIAVGVYLSAGLFRLAKFNLTSAQQQHFFIGLPVPMAAFFIASVILSHDWLASSVFHHLLSDQALVASVIALGVLMVSTVNFPSFKKSTLRMPLALVQVGLLLFAGWWCLSRGYPILFLGLLGYLASGFIHALYVAARRVMANRRRV